MAALIQHDFVATPTMPLPMENSPQVVFERLFGDGTNSAQRLARKKQDHSILDSVTDKVARLQGQLDPSDRTRLGEYLDDIREIERRIQKATQQSANSLDVPEAPVGIPEAFDDHIKLMYDLLTIAWRAEITRISTLMYARDTSGATYPGSGVRDGFHTASHHSNVRANMDRFALINQYHVKTLGIFWRSCRRHRTATAICWITRRRSTGSSRETDSQHDYYPLPIIVAAAPWAVGRTAFEICTAYADVESDAGAAGKHGVDQEKFGDSTGKLEIRRAEQTSPVVQPGYHE